MITFWALSNQNVHKLFLGLSHPLNSRLPQIFWMLLIESLFFINLKALILVENVQFAMLIKAKKICQFKSHTTVKVYDINTFITCTSKNVVYLLIFSCGLQYVDRTMSAMNVRFKEHLANIRKGFPKHTVSRHYLKCHNKNPAGTTVIAIDRFTPHWRGCVTKREISWIETHWIYDLKCYNPFGLNVDWNVNSFINTCWFSQCFSFFFPYTLMSMDMCSFSVASVNGCSSFL